MKPLSQKWLGRITLLVLAGLFVLNLIIGSCHLLLCGAFVATVVAYMVLSDYGRA
jgi:hypothetical protein